MCSNGVPARTFLLAGIMSPIGMLLYGYCISISTLGLLYYCNRGYLSTTTEICGANRGKMGVDSSSSSNDSRSIMNSSCVEVLCSVVFFSAAERPFRARSAAERRVAR